MACASKLQRVGRGEPLRPCIIAPNHLLNAPDKGTAAAAPARPRPNPPIRHKHPHRHASPPVQRATDRSRCAPFIHSPRPSARPPAFCTVSSAHGPLLRTKQGQREDEPSPPIYFPNNQGARVARTIDHTRSYCSPNPDFEPCTLQHSNTPYIKHLVIRATWRRLKCATLSVDGHLSIRASHD